MCQERVPLCILQRMLVACKALCSHVTEHVA